MGKYRVLVLQDPFTAFPQHRLKMIETVVSRDGYRVPSFPVRSYQIATYGSLFAIFSILALICSLMYVKCEKSRAQIALISSLIIFIILCIIMVVSMKRLILSKATQIANNYSRDFKPNIILAQGYGAKIALRMNKPRIPMVFISPIAFERWLPKSCSRTRYTEFPFVLILHGYKDSQNPIINSVILSGFFDRTRVKLDVLECDNHFTILTADMLSSWLEEAYTRGKSIVEELEESGRTFVDKSLFNSTSNV